MDWIKCFRKNESDNPIKSLRGHVNHFLDTKALREDVKKAHGIAFIANGSLLPNANCSSSSVCADLSQIVPFVSPPSFEHEFVLPHHGPIRGMLVPSGLTVIVGGGFHGKSTLLNALKIGAFDRPPGNGCDFVVTISGNSD